MGAARPLKTVAGRNVEICPGRTRQIRRGVGIFDWVGPGRRPEVCEINDLHDSADRANTWRKKGLPSAERRLLGGPLP